MIKLEQGPDPDAGWPQQLTFHGQVWMSDPGEAEELAQHSVTLWRQEVAELGYEMVGPLELSLSDADFDLAGPRPLRGRVMVQPREGA